MTVSDDSRHDGKDEAPAELAEAKAARELAEAMEGKSGARPDEEALAAAVAASAARKLELTDDAKARIADDLFGPAVAQTKPSHWRGLAIAASVLVVAGGLFTVGGGAMMAKRAPEAAAPVTVDSPESRDFHRKAEVLIAEMMPQPTAAERAQAIAERARARLKREAAP